VEWIGNRFDELVDLAIRSIAPDALPQGAEARLKRLASYRWAGSNDPDALPQDAAPPL
jgi:hypothetical protein